MTQIHTSNAKRSEKILSLSQDFLLLLINDSYTSLSEVFIPLSKSRTRAAAEGLDVLIQTSLADAVYVPLYPECNLEEGELSRPCYDAASQCLAHKGQQPNREGKQNKRQN